MCILCGNSSTITSGRLNKLVALMLWNTIFMFLRNRHH